MHYPSLVINLRRGVDDMLARKWTNDDVGFALDQAAKIIQGELSILKNRRSTSLVANQQEYDMDSTLLKMEEVEFYDVDTVWKVEAETLDTFRDWYRNANTTASVPKVYTTIEEERKILLSPRPDTSAATTTISQDHTAAVTTITVASSASLPTSGYIIIDSEVIQYTAKTSTTLTGAVRGAQGTTAATHSSGATVTERDLQFWQTRKYADREMRNFYSTGTVAITKDTTALVGTSTVWSTSGLVAAGDYFGITANATEVDPVQWYKISSITDNTNIVLADTYTGVTQTTGTYIIGSPNPFPEYVDPALIALARSFMLEKEGRLDLSGREFAKYSALMTSIRKSRRKSDRQLIVGGRDGKFMGPPMPIRYFDRTLA